MRILKRILLWKRARVEHLCKRGSGCSFPVLQASKYHTAWRQFFHWQTPLNIISCFYRGNKTRAGFLGEENVKLVSSTHTLSHLNNYIYFLLQTQELMKCRTSPHSLSCVIRTWWTLHYSLLVRSWIKLTLVTDESSRHEDNMCDCGLALRCENKT